jgi:hypothetical protein
MWPLLRLADEQKDRLQLDVTLLLLMYLNMNTRAVHPVTKAVGCWAWN